MTETISAAGAVASPDIDLTPAGVKLGDTLMTEVSLAALTEALGDPRIIEPSEPSASVVTWYVWDDAGIFTLAKPGAEPTEIRIALADDTVKAERRGREREAHKPARNFSGSLTIRGKDPREAVAAKDRRMVHAMMGAKAGDWRCELMTNKTELGFVDDMSFSERFAKAESGELAEAVLAAEAPFSQAYIFVDTKPKPAKPSGRWKLPEATEPVLEIKSFPFRLAIIEELMYHQGVLKPRFDVHHFAQDRGARNFDPNEYYTEMIPAVRTWFRKLPIPARLAEKVESLVLDGGNEVNLQLIPQWDGEDGAFDIPSLTPADLDLFPNLRTVEDIGGMLGPRARKALEARGIEIQ